MGHERKRLKAQKPSPVASLKSARRAASRFVNNKRLEKHNAKAVLGSYFGI